MRQGSVHARRAHLDGVDGLRAAQARRRRRQKLHLKPAKGGEEPAGARGWPVGARPTSNTHREGATRPRVSIFDRHSNAAPCTHFPSWFGPCHRERATATQGTRERSPSWPGVKPARNSDVLLRIHRSSFLHQQPGMRGHRQEVGHHQDYTHVVLSADEQNACKFRQDKASSVGEGWTLSATRRVCMESSGGELVGTACREWPPLAHHAVHALLPLILPKRTPILCALLPAALQSEVNRLWLAGAALLLVASNAVLVLAAPPLAGLPAALAEQGRPAGGLMGQGWRTGWRGRRRPGRGGWEVGWWWWGWGGGGAAFF